MEKERISWAAGELLTAQSLIQSREPLGKTFADMTLSDAYEIQNLGMKLRIEKGARQVGWKMGLTSPAKRQQMNLDSAIFGYLLDVGAVKSASFDCSGLIHPRVECEIGFRMKSGLKGKVSHAQALQAIGGVCAAFEIIDSRYKNFKYFSLPDVVADNCSAGLYQFGEFVSDFSKIDLAKLQMRFSIDGVEVQNSLSADISGHPLNSLCELSEMLAGIHQEIRPGDIVLAGAPGVAIEAKAGQSFELKIDQLPPVFIKGA